jgi:SAM-dependent methyltransferase
MVRCAETGLVFSREILPDEMLGALYAESKVTFSAQAGIIRADYWRPLERLGKRLKRGAALEIGCSSGFFLEELLARGFGEVQGCEPSVEAKALAAPSVRGRIRTGFFTEDAYPDATFDLICCFQTLDHLGDPMAMLRACHRKLKPGGLLYVIVHDSASLQARIFGERSPIIDVEHIYLFNRRTLPMAALKAGFSNAECRPLTNAYPLGHLAAHAPLPGKRAIQAALGWTGLGGLSPRLRLGNLSLIARKAD